MFRRWLHSGAHKWLVRLLVFMLLVPTPALYAMPAQQTVETDTPSCHQVQQQAQFAVEATTQDDCCSSSDNCMGDCEHDCTDCYSSGSVPAVITATTESQITSTSRYIPVSSSHTGLVQIILLRPPCQVV